MTVTQLIKQDCANMNPDGSCNGPRYDDKLQPVPNVACERCMITDGKRCLYFEESILPGVEDVDIVWEYKKINSYVVASDRKCPECGVEIPKRKRYCENCTRKRRILSHRRHNAKRV